MEQYNYLSRFANDVILLIDDDGIIVTANDRATEVYGYSQIEIPGMNIRRLRASAIQHTFEADWQLAHERGSLIFETVHQRKDGSEFAVEVSTRSIAVDGKTLQQSIIRDISDRKRAEQELSESESRFRQLVENAPYGIVVVEGQIILYANPEAVRMFGAATPADLVGHSLLERARAEEHESMQRRVREVMAGVSPVVERRYLRLNGEEFWAAVSAAEIEYNQRPAGLLFYRDITAVKRAEEEHARLEEQLRQSQKMESVGRLAGGVAHDFNNYLTVINGYCEMLLEGSDAGPEIRDGLQEIRAAGGRAAAITQQLLAFSRKQIATPTVLSLNQVVTDSGQLLQRLIGEDITIVTRLDADPGNVMGGPATTGPGPDEPGDQCARCHATRRADRDRDRQKGNRRGGGIALRGPAGPVFRPFGCRYGCGYECGDSAKDLRTVLYYQGSGYGHRARAKHGIRHCAPCRRLDRRAEFARNRFAVRDLAAPDRRRRLPMPALHRLPPLSRAAQRHCS